MRRFTAEPRHPSLAIVINMTEATTHLPSTWGADVVLASDPNIATLSDDKPSHLVMAPRRPCGSVVEICGQLTTRRPRRASIPAVYEKT